MMNSNSPAFLELQKAIQIFDVRDMTACIHECLSWLKAATDAENVIWLDHQEYKKIRSLREKSLEYKISKFEEVRFFSSPLISLEQGLAKDIASELGAFVWQQPEENNCRWHSKSADYQVWKFESKELRDRIGFFFIKGAKQRPVLDGEMKIIENLLQNAHTFEQSKRMSYVDHLTCLYNQRYLPIVLDREIHRADRYNSHFSLLFLDIDHFKNVNDSNGHVVGSEIISQLGDVLMACVRDSDYGFRFGGDEFVLILVETDSQKALAVAERIRKQIETRTFVVDGQKFSITVSIGIATCPEHARTKEEILELADQAMYYGKNTSRNVTYIAS